MGAVRADRLLQLLLLLQARGRMTAGELAERLEVSVRTVQRDMDALSAAGVPVYASRGGEGGWQLVDGFRTDLTGLTPSEALAVAIARPSTVLRDLGVDDADVGMLKVMAALPVLAQQAAEHARQRVHVDLEPWPGRADGDRELLRTLWRATTTDAVTRITYGVGQPAFAVEPLGLVAKGAVWYVVAARHRSGELRTYRVARIGSIDVTDEHFDRPVDFDLAAHWQRACDALPHTWSTLVVTLRVTAAGLQRLRWASGAPLDIGRRVDDTWVRVRVDLESVDEATAVVLGLGADGVVERPAALRTAVRRAADALVANHR